eukprot:TRINITY_DN1922_c4_g1_i1.p1 TRINITY_DN1922_c4_g1~~TRINITY_DN1922_c4_g1_i1.p1  ORF type:complete len:419 (-),score=-55.00 TRINITY_DN1922_c4_g1_i1:9-1265(-)
MKTCNTACLEHRLHGMPRRRRTHRREPGMLTRQDAASREGRWCRGRGGGGAGVVFFCFLFVAAGVCYAPPRTGDRGWPGFAAGAGGRREGGMRGRLPPRRPPVVCPLQGGMCSNLRFFPQAPIYARCTPPTIYHQGMGRFSRRAGRSSQKGVRTNIGQGGRKEEHLRERAQSCDFTGTGVSGGRGWFCGCVCENGNYAGAVPTRASSRARRGGARAVMLDSGYRRLSLVGKRVPGKPLQAAPAECGTRRSSAARGAAAARAPVAALEAWRESERTRPICSHHLTLRSNAVHLTRLQRTDRADRLCLKAGARWRVLGAAGAARRRAVSRLSCTRTAPHAGLWMRRSNFGALGASGEQLQRRSTRPSSPPLPAAPPQQASPPSPPRQAQPPPSSHPPPVPPPRQQRARHPSAPPPARPPR